MKMLEKFLDLLKNKNILYDRIVSLHDFFHYAKTMDIIDNVVRSVSDTHIEFKSKQDIITITIIDYAEEYSLHYYEGTYEQYCQHQCNTLFSCTVTPTSVTVYPMLNNNFGAKEINQLLLEVENYLYTTYNNPREIKRLHELEKKKLMKGIYEVQK